MNKGNPRKALGTRPQPTTSPRYGKALRTKLEALRQNSNVSALHIHFLFTSFILFQHSELWWAPEECYFTKSVQDSCGSEGRIAPLIFDQQCKSVYSCAYARTQNQLKNRLVISRSRCQKQDQCFGFPYQEHPVSKLIWVRGLRYGVIYEPEVWNKTW